jgi:hypothetical protein
MPSLHTQNTNHEINRPLWHIQNPTIMDMVVTRDPLPYDKNEWNVQVKWN